MPFSFGLAFGGGGGRGALGDLGGLRKSCASSGTLAPGTQSAIPSRQTSVSPLIAPEAASTPTSTRVSGPVSVSPSITYHMAAGTLGMGKKTVPPPVRVVEGGKAVGGSRGERARLGGGGADAGWTTLALEQRHHLTHWGYT